MRGSTLSKVPAKGTYKCVGRRPQCRICDGFFVHYAQTVCLLVQHRFSRMGVVHLELCDLAAAPLHSASPHASHPHYPGSKMTTHMQWTSSVMACWARIKVIIVAFP
jgi:hypothetical protein